MNFVIMCCPGREDMVARLRQSLVGHVVVETWDTKREGAMIGALRAFELGLDCFKDRPFTVLQDDAELCTHFADYAEQFMADIANRQLVIQWYAHGWVAGGLMPDFHTSVEFGTRSVAKFDEFGGHDYVCSLATTYPREWAEKIRDHLKDQVEHDGQRDDQGRMHGDDAAIADVLAYHRKEFYVHVPSLVQHVGHVSMVAGRSVTLESHDARTSRCYVGSDFDARMLTGRVSVPWRAEQRKERIPMDDNADKKVGDMTARELYDALSAFDEESEEENNVRTQAHLLQSLIAGAPPSSDVKLAPPVGNCNVCGDTSGDCGHAPSPKVEAGRRVPDSE